MDEPKTTTRRWRTILLVTSLALNLIVIGAVAGLMLSGGPRGGPGRFDLTVGPLARALEAPQRDAVRQALRDSDAFRPGDRRAMRADLQTLVEVVGAERFDRATFEAVLARQRDRLQAGQRAALIAVGDVIDAMPADDRAAFAARLADQMQRGRDDQAGRDAGSGG